MLRKIPPVLVALLLIVAVVPAPAAAAWFGDDSTPPTRQYSVEGSLVDSYVVELEPNRTDAIRTWAAEDSSRSLIAVNNTTNNAVVAAPSWAVDAGRLERLMAFKLVVDQLDDKAYVEEIHRNYLTGLPDQITVLENETSFQPPKKGAFRFDDSWTDPGYPMDGVATSNDAKQTNMSAIRDSLGVGNVTGAVDTSGYTEAVIDTGVRTADGRVFGNGSTGSTLRILNASADFTGPNITTVAEGGLSAIEDQNGHGTWTAAAMAGNPNGTKYDAPAKNANLLVLKALDEEGQGSVHDIARAIRYAADHDATVISLSLGSKVQSEPVEQAIRYAYNHGVKAVVVAAGNSRTTRSPGVASPGDMPRVITVGATNGSTPAHAWSAYFSQTSGAQPTDGNLSETGEHVDVVAPGMKSVTKVPTSAGYVRTEAMTGTSMATPEVTSALLYAMAANGTLASWNHTKIHDAVAKTARPVPNAAAVEAGNGMFATDNLVDGTVPTQSQSEAMTDAARTRNRYYEASSDSRGGVFQSTVSITAASSQQATAAA